MQTRCERTCTSIDFGLAFSVKMGIKCESVVPGACGKERGLDGFSVCHSTVPFGNGNVEIATPACVWRLTHQSRSIRTVDTVGKSATFGKSTHMPSSFAEVK
eukprot:scaffold214731_cov46-Attheya_sp.AAC.1